MNREKMYISAVGRALADKYKLRYDQLNKKYNLNLPDEVPVDASDENLNHKNFDQVLELNKRILTGSYYTPPELADHMVRMAFSDYMEVSGTLTSEESELFFFSDQVTFNETKQEALVNKIRKMRILDPSCGSGVFLKATYELIKKIYESFYMEFSVSDIFSRLHGIDIQEAPLTLVKLWCLDQQLKVSENVKMINLSCEDAIMFRTDVKFDLVITNPPYLGEKGNKALFDRYKHLQGYEARMDLFYLFVYKGLELLNDDGVLHYITTNYWVTADSALKLRRHLKANTSIVRMINLDNYKLFKDAQGMHNLIFSITPKKNLDSKIAVISEEKPQDRSVLYKTKYHSSQASLYASNDNLLLYENFEYKGILDKIQKKGRYELKDYVNINQGIVSGADKVTSSMLEKKLSNQSILDHGITLDDPIFVHQASGPLAPWLKPFYKNSHIRPYKVDLANNQWILYLTDEDILDDCDMAYKHLLPFKALLERRREVKLGRRKWYALQWYRNQAIFEAKKIVAPQRSRMNVFAYVEEPFYTSADVYFLTGEPLKALVGILNSKLMFFWLYTRGKRKGKDLELYAKPLSQIPMLDLSDFDLLELEKWVDLYRETGKQALLKKIDHWVYDAYGLNDYDINLIEDLYDKRRRKDGQ